MDSKERILKMLEEGKITSEEAIRLMETMDKKEGQDHSASADDAGEKKKDDDGYWDGGMVNDLFQQFMGEVNKYVNPDKLNKTYKDVNQRANRTYQDVRTKFDSNQQASQVFKSVERAFDSVKNTNFDSVFSGGAKNRLIETIDESYSSISLDITNGDIKIVPTDRVQTAKFEVTPFYRKLDDKRNYFQDIICEVKNEELVIVSDIRAAKVNVELNLNPETIRRLIITGSNGNVSLKDQDIKDLTIDVLNGHVKLEDTVTDHAFVRTSKGNISVEKGAYGDVELISMVGTINTDQFNAKDITVSANGSVNMTLQSTTDSATINTNMGSVNLSIPQGRPLEGRLSTVVGQLNYPPEVDARFMKHQDFGLKELMLVNDSDEPGLFIEVSTKFGSVTLHRT
ncbi:DUF4097 family beta strand repeat-containing protein [Lacicoccus alkaliphilus]|uniref:DUF4097 and DUF4098 domain-containing protein YvlB n=1 Tax=Lacicoccus alkaliphilus DSM 16010 TaxID=1123231 RepID=A0A1M7FA79_9BACL|nr:DUF4097 family beta strand repeat-containing protein [Salinicoccus alkaliphilus]SHM00926.1 DUF4097 and DUF4098 domain-containing protein YvlB [Salinicoccus alkaliphilus DSM 16010]